MKKIFIIVAVLFLTVSCELTKVVDENPPNNLVAENVIQNEDDAKALLNGIYSTITANLHYYMYTELIPSTLIGSMSSFGGFLGGFDFAINDLRPNDADVGNLWLAFYEVVDLSNNVIAYTDAFPDSEFSGNNKSEIIGEAYFFRAMGTFDALRYFGQFFDVNSNLGIVLNTEPANFVTRHKPRSTVADCYAQILSDLDKAIADAPDFSVPYRASKTAAKALKAKVLLFMGRYSEAATIADEVINGGSVGLEGDFESVFSNGFSSSEMILMLYRHENSFEDDNNRKEFYSPKAGTTWYLDIMETDPRAPLTYLTVSSWTGTSVNVTKTNNRENFAPTYFMRLAEMHLIKAEALAMDATTPEEIAAAKAPLDVIRNRAGIGNSAATTVDDLKDDIFDEIVRELAFENGSEWFAAIRLGKATTLKSTITSPNKYILPIPETEIFGNNAISVTDQNPGYNQL